MKRNLLFLIPIAALLRILFVFSGNIRKTIISTNNARTGAAEIDVLDLWVNFHPVEKFWTIDVLCRGNYKTTRVDYKSENLSGDSSPINNANIFMLHLPASSKPRFLEEVSVPLTNIQDQSRSMLSVYVWPNPKNGTILSNYE